MWRAFEVPLPGTEGATCTLPGQANDQVSAYIGSVRGVVVGDDPSSDGYEGYGDYAGWGGEDSLEANTVPDQIRFRGSDHMPFVECADRLI